MFYILLDFNQYRFVPVVHVQTSQIQAWNINTIQRVDSRGNGTCQFALYWNKLPFENRPRSRYPGGWFRDRRSF